MKSKKLTLTMSFLLFSFFFMATSCGEPDTSENLQETALQGTTWKLKGYVNTKTGSIIKPEPKDCEPCYTIAFTSEAKGTARSIANTIKVDLSAKPFFGGMTKVGDNEIGNVLLFYETILSLQSYSVENNELKFFYDSKQQYLLFKPVEP